MSLARVSGEMMQLWTAAVPAHFTTSEDIEMTTTHRRLVIAGLAIGVSAIVLSSVRAQDASHKGHDAAGPAAATAPKEPNSAGQAAVGKSDHMQTMHDNMQAKHKSMMGSGGMKGGGAMLPGSGDSSPSSQAFKAINTQMHHAMAISFTGDADSDFVKGMIPHHLGAIDMAKVVLGFGKDPEIRKLAENVIKVQEAEIAQMNTWLKAKAQ
jgi:hypothetical protein